MAFTTTPPLAKGGTTLPVDVVNEVRGDWSNAALFDSQPGDAAASVVTFPLGADATSRTNQAYDVVEVARAAASAAMGSEAYKARMDANQFIGSRSSVSKPIPAVKGNADKGIEASEAVPAMITVQTNWKQRTS